MALGVFFVLLAILVSLVRFGGPLLNQHRQALLNTLLADSKLEASVDRIGLDWTRRGPALELQQLVIAPNSGRFALRLGKVWAHLDFWRSLNELKPVFGQLILSDGDIALDLGQPAEPETGNGSDQQQALLRFLLTQLSTFDIHDTRLSLTTALGRCAPSTSPSCAGRTAASAIRGRQGLSHQRGGREHPRSHRRCGCPQVRLDRLKGQLYLGPVSSTSAPCWPAPIQGSPR